METKGYLDSDTTYAETCRIFNCSERSLKRWIYRFQNEDEIKRHNREPISYKVDKELILNLRVYGSFII
jgi:transposase-like protein